MILIEIDHPAGALSDDDRALIGTSIMELFVTADGHAEETLRRARAATHVAFRELHGWRTGDGVPSADIAPPMIVTLTVPKPWQDEAAPTFIGLVRTAVKRLDDQHGRERAPASLWVRVDGVPDGSIGLDGRPVSADDVLDFLTEEYRDALAKGTAAAPPSGKLIDPICGMTVHDGKGSIIVEDRGFRVGFCSQGCRDAYLRRGEETVGAEHSYVSRA